MCDLTNHNLIDIYTRSYGDEDTVVRWCKDCGAIVIDTDYDNRTYPGKIMQMKLPKMAKDKKEKQKTPDKVLTFGDAIKFLKENEENDEAIFYHARIIGNKEFSIYLTADGDIRKKITNNNGCFDYLPVVDEIFCDWEIL